MKNKELKQFLGYIIPGIIAMLGSSSYILADTIFIAQINEFSLAALNICLPIYSVLFAISLMVSVGSSTYYSIYVARRNTKNASIYFTNAIKIIFIASIIFAGGVLIFRIPLAYFLGANNETIGMCEEYIVGFITFTPMFMLHRIISAFVRNDNNPKLASKSALIASIFNIVFDYIFIFPFNMGMFGAALATGISPIVGLMIYIPLFKNKRNNFKYIKSKIDFSVMKNIIKLGIPSFIQGSASGIVMIVFNKQLLSIGGNLGVTAYGIIANILIVLQELTVGISEGVQPLISSNFGSANYNKIKVFSKFAIFSMITIGLIGSFITIFANEFAISIFDPRHDQSLRNITSIGLMIYFIGVYPMGINNFYSIFFTSIEKPLPSTLIAVLRSGLVISPLLFILPKFLDINGVWVSYPLAEFIIFLVGTIFFIKEIKKFEKHLVV